MVEKVFCGMRNWSVLRSAGSPLGALTDDSYDAPQLSFRAY
jgi:hypothetical protein